jgi:hypothetical protein
MKLSGDADRSWLGSVRPQENGRMHFARVGLEFRRRLGLLMLEPGTLDRQSRY